MIEYQEQDMLLNIMKVERSARQRDMEKIERKLRSMLGKERESSKDIKK